MVIPKEIRESLDINPGEKFEAIQYEDRIEYIPVKSIKKMRGFLKGIDANIERDGDRI